MPGKGWTGIELKRVAEVSRTAFLFACCLLRVLKCLPGNNLLRFISILY